MSKEDSILLLANKQYSTFNQSTYFVYASPRHEYLNLTFYEPSTTNFTLELYKNNTLDRLIVISQGYNFIYTFRWQICY